jgi:3-methyl-2-oxobutanoate hydroxymethyltransferase
VNAKQSTQDPRVDGRDRQEKVTLRTLRRMKRRGEKAVFITAYDYPTAMCVDAAGVDMILVGDSVANTTLGFKYTTSVTMEDMIRHSGAVTRAVERAFVIGDMPYMSYQPSDEAAIRNAGRFVAEAGCDAVKCEGGARVAPRIRAMVDAGLVVMGHIGLTPQSLAQLGGYRVQGKTSRQVEALTEDVEAIEEAGAQLVLLEAMPPEVGAALRDAVEVPVYGIGAGPHVDGQLLILHDVIGMQDPSILRKPRFVKRYADVGSVIVEAVSRYSGDVRSGVFPSKEHFYRG